MLISSPAVEKEWGWGNGLSNPWQMRGFHSKEWPWEFSFGQTRLRSKAGILFSVGSGRRFASSRSQPGLHGLPPTAPAPASPKQDREGEGRARANAGGDALKKPLSKEGRESVQNSKARPSDSRRHSERILLGHLFRSPLLSSPFNWMPRPSLSSMRSVTSVSYLSGHQFFRLSMTSPKDVCRTLFQERRLHRP